MVDYQSGHETTITAILPALSGCNVIYGLGMLEMGITFDLGQLMLDNEVAGMIKHAVNGIEVSDLTLAVDAIKEVGPFSDFLAHDSTYDYMRSRSSAKLLDRQMRPRWQDMGGKDAYTRACEEVRHRLETYQPPQLSDSVLKDVSAIVSDAEAELGIS